MKGQLRYAILCYLILFTAGCGSENNRNQRGVQGAQKKDKTVYPIEIDKELAHIKAQRSVLNESHKKALASQDLVLARKIQLELNFLEEMEGALISDSKDSIQMTKSKYTVLRQIFEDGLKNSIPSMSINKADYTPNDEPYPSPFVSSYHPLVLAEVRKVFNDFGDLYVNATVDINGKMAPQELRVARPWSGYWYPLRDKSLYEGINAPLGKLDAVLRQIGHHTRISDTERETFGLYSADGWEGLCDAWSLASVMSPEPTQSITLSGKRFSVSDQKALLLLAHSAYPYKQYGITYRGDADTDGTFQDIKPEAFHKIVTHVLGNEKRALVINESAGVEVWNKPLYYYRWKIVQDPKLEYAFLVTGYPWIINQRKTVTDELTGRDDTIAPIYHYRLYVDKNIVKDGKFRVIAGQWIKDSRRYHPGNVKYPILGADLKSHNTELNKYMAIYQKLFLNK